MEDGQGSAADPKTQGSTLPACFRPSHPAPVSIGSDKLRLVGVEKVTVVDHEASTVPRIRSRLGARTSFVDVCNPGITEGRSEERLVFLPFRLRCSSIAKLPAMVQA